MLFAIENIADVAKAVAGPVLAAGTIGTMRWCAKMLKRLESIDGGIKKINEVDGKLNTHVDDDTGTHADFKSRLDGHDRELGVINRRFEREHSPMNGSAS